VKAALAGILGVIVIAVGAFFVLGGIQEPVSERYAVPDSVRLDR
jgi:hypothetical protein